MLYEYIAYTQENLGKKDPQYGGVLTDMSKLPIGTTSFVCNGCWNGEITLRDGKRCVKILGDPSLSANPAAKPVTELELFPEGSDGNILAMSLIKFPD